MAERRTRRSFTREFKVSNDIRNPAASDIENPATPVTLMPRPEPVRHWI